MIFPLCKWYFDIRWHKFEKRWADVFQIYPNAIHLNPLQFCSSMPLLGFPFFFFLSSSIVLNHYFHILNSMTIWSVLKLPKIAWPSPFKNKWIKPFCRFCCGFPNATTFRDLRETDPWPSKRIRSYSLSGVNYSNGNRERAKRALEQWLSPEWFLPKNP